MQDNFFEYKTKPGENSKKFSETVSALLINQLLAQTFPRHLSDEAWLHVIQKRIQQDIDRNGSFQGIMLIGCWESASEMERIYKLLKEVYGLKVDDKCNMTKNGYRVSFRINNKGMDGMKLKDFMSYTFIV